MGKMKRRNLCTLVVLFSFVFLLSVPALGEAIFRNISLVIALKSVIDTDRPQSSNLDSIVDHFLRLKTKNISSLRAQGIIFTWKNNLEAALPVLNQAIAREPNDVIARQFLATIYEENNDPISALAQLNSIEIKCENITPEGNQNVARICMKAIEKSITEGSGKKYINAIKSILQADPLLLWGKWRLAQMIGLARPCLTDILPARIDQYTDTYIKRKNAEALLNLAFCANSDEHVKYSAVRYLHWLGMDDVIENVVGQDEVKHLQAQFGDVEITDTGSATEDHPNEFAKNVTKALGIPAEQVELGPNLITFGDIENKPNQPSDWRPTYQVGGQYYGKGIYDIGEENQKPLDGKQSVRISGVYADRGKDTRAGVWAEKTLRLGAGCYLFHLKYKTSSDVGDYQAWVWSASGDVPEEIRLWDGYFPLPPSDGKKNNLDIIGCLPKKLSPDVDLYKYIEKKYFSDLPVTRALGCMLNDVMTISNDIRQAEESDIKTDRSIEERVNQCMEESTLRGGFKLFLSMSGEGVTWYDDVQLRRIFLDDLPEELIGKPIILINGIPVEQ